ncbi:MAG: CDGSH iron-sulfur domain-containing protein [Balneolaceae bacterium]|nr:CDGSH iron-sulfur domain-containing protein [Balneolaceae bacterium]
MAEPKVAQVGPFVMEIEPGNYAWCACGESDNQPYCDGSHTSTEFTPIVEKIEEPKRVAWCGCKHSGSKPYCDGTHKKLKT